MNVGSDTHGKQVAKIMKEFDDFCEEHSLDMVVVVGDVNSTMAYSQVADFLLPPSKGAVENLIKKRHKSEQIHLVGDILIDTLLKNQHKILRSDIIPKLEVKLKEFALVTLHRPSNVDDEKSLRNIIEALKIIQERVKVVFPFHPRTKKNIEEFGLLDRINFLKNIILTEPLGYFDFGKRV